MHPLILSFWTFIAFIYGAFLGSMAGALLPRIHQNIPWLSLDRSRCDHCQKALSWKALIPIFSYFFQKKHSLCCKKALDFPYGWVELSLGLLFALFFIFFYEASVSFYLELILWSLFALLALEDILYQSIHEKILIWGFAVVIFAYISGIWDFSFQRVALQISISFIFFGAQYFLSRGKALGFGDVELGLWMALILHRGNLPEAILSAYIFASTFGLIALFFGFVKRKSRLPLAPFLALGTFLGYYGPNFLFL